MFAQVHCFILLALVSGSLCAPSPGKYRIGVSHGVSGRSNTNFAGKAISGGLNSGLANASASGKLGISGSGDVDGSVFVQVNDKINELAGDYHASAGGWVKPKIGGQVGKDANGKVIGGRNSQRSYGEWSGAGSGGLHTDQDALIKYHEHQARTADDILSEMDDEDY